MKATTIRLLVTLVVVGAALGWAAATVVVGWSGRSLSVPVLAGASLWLLAVSLFVWGRIVRPRLQARYRSDIQAEPLPVLVAARVAALAVAASRTGALVSGVYLGILTFTVARGVNTPAAVQTLWSALMAAGGAGATCLVAMWIERACLIPLGDDDGQ